MSSEFKVALVQFNSVVGNPLGNARRMATYMQQAASQGARLVVFPELCVDHYHAQDVFLNPAVQAHVAEAVVWLRQEAQRLGLSILFGHSAHNPDQAKGQKLLINAVSLLGPVFAEVTRAKTLLPTYREFMENRWFEAGSAGQIKPQALHENSSASNALSIGYVVCEEGWNNPVGLGRTARLYALDPIDYLAHASEHIRAIFNISASPGYMGKLGQVLEMNAKLAREYHLPMIWVNTVGFQDQLGFWGGTHVFNSKGELVTLLARDQEELFVFDLLALDALPVISGWPQSNSSEDSLMRELDQAMGLYLKDYFHKSGLAKTWPQSRESRFEQWQGLKGHWDKIPEGGVLLGLSGGVDSSLVATVAVRHLGPDKVLGVYMPSQYNSAQESAQALELGRNLGIPVLVEPIEAAVEYLGQNWRLTRETLAHENLQARLRAMILWTIANAKNKTVLNTTNWTEAAMGYGTIGGDLLGLPLIASLPKSLVYRLARYYAALPEPSITQDVLDMVPTAALRPNQTDEASLGARYWVLDAVLEDLFMNYGNVQATSEKFLNDAAFVQRYEPYNGVPDKRDSLKQVILRCATTLLKTTEFKRCYYNRTPQFTPYAWLRWQWPMANDAFQISYE